MQLSDIRTRVRERLGLSTSDTAVTDTILTQTINAANRKIAVLHDWPWLQSRDTTFTTTTSGKSTYDQGSSEIASNWRKTLYLSVNGDEVLRAKQPQDLVRYSQNTGVPVFYTNEDDTIILAPTPDSAYDVVHFYIKQVADLSGDTDVPDIEDWAIDLLIEGAAVLVAKRLRDFDLARSIQEEYALTLDSLRDEVRRTRQPVLPKHRTDIGWP